VILGVEPVERGAKIVDFPGALVVLDHTQSGSTKVEAQHRKAKTVQRLHGVEHDFVVQRSAEQRMGMTDHCSVRGVGCSGVEQRLQASGRTLKKQGADG